MKETKPSRDQGQIVDEVVAVIRDSLSGLEVRPDRIAHAFIEIKEKVAWILEGHANSPTRALAEQWWKEVLERTEVDALAEADGVIRNLLMSNDITETTKQRLYRAHSLLERGREDNTKATP